MMQKFKVKVLPASFMLLIVSGQLMAEKAMSPDSAGVSPSSDKAASSLVQSSNQNGVDFVALPNPVRDRKDRVILMCRTRCMGTARLNIYDAVGSMVYQKTIPLREPDAVGHKMCIPWDCRNRKGRFVGNGTYLGVISLFDMENRPLTRHTVNIGVAYY